MELFSEEKKNIYSFKNRAIRFFRLKGSWYWAKKQMLKGKKVRCSHWSGALVLRIDSPENQLLQANFHRVNRDEKWETSNHHLSYELFTDYEVVFFI
jgi:hypothetical protein